MSDAALLALIVDDDAALKTLAAWASLRPGLAHALDDGVLSDLCEVSGVWRRNIEQIVKRLMAARVLTDDGISELADKLLQTHVQQRIGGGKKRR